MVGGLAREAIFPFAATWALTRQWRWTVAALACAAAAYAIPRLVIRTDVSAIDYFTTAIQRDGLYATPGTFAREAVLSWGYLFVVALAGFALLPREARPRAGIAAGALGVIAIVSCLVAVDFGRMFEVLGPVIGLLCAQAICALRRASPLATPVLIAWGALMAFEVLAIIPNRLVSAHDPDAFRLGIEVAGPMLLAVTLILIRRPSVPAPGPVASGADERAQGA